MNDQDVIDVIERAKEFAKAHKISLRNALKAMEIVEISALGYKYEELFERDVIPELLGEISKSIKETYGVNTPDDTE